MRDRMGSAWLFTQLLKLLSWRELLLLAAAGTLVVVAAVIASVLFFLLFPLFLAVAALLRWKARREAQQLAQRECARFAARSARVVVVDPDAIEILPPRR